MEVEVGQGGGLGVARLLGRDQLAVQLREFGQVRGGQQGCRLLGRQPLEQHADLAQLLVARDGKFHDLDGLARPHLEAALAHELHDGFPDGSLADAHRQRDLTNTQSLPRPEAAGHQRLSKLAMNAGRQIFPAADR